MRPAAERPPESLWSGVLHSKPDPARFLIPCAGFFLARSLRLWHAQC
jgi:hypothetical protein